MTQQLINSSRRRFMQATAAGVGVAMLPASFSLMASAQPRVGLQLYTLRDMMAVSVEATLKLVAAVGYKEMEFAGYYEHSPKAIRSLLDGEGMTAPSTHVMLQTFDKLGDNKIIEDAQVVGHNYIVIPYLMPEQRGTTIDTYQKLAERLNELGEKCKKAGIQLAYHNHDFEFEVRSNKVMYDVLLDETDADLVAMEMDLYWVTKAGKDPLAYFKRNPGRFQLWHVKDMDKEGNFADVGTGTIDFARIFAASEQAGVKHRFVERDLTQDKLKTIQTSYQAVAKLMAG